jgi:hypothetical protein
MVETKYLMGIVDILPLVLLIRSSAKRCRGLRGSEVWFILFSKLHSDLYAPGKTGITKIWYMYEIVRVSIGYSI